MGKQPLTNASEDFKQQPVSRENYKQTAQKDLTSTMNIMYYDDAINLIDKAFWNGDIQESNRVLDEFIKGCDFRYNRLVQCSSNGTQMMVDKICIREGINLILLKINMINLSSNLSTQEKTENIESIYDKVILYAKNCGLRETEYIKILQQYLDFLIEHDMSDKAKQIKQQLEELRKRQI